VELSSAKKIAMDIVEILSPHCERIEIAGSIRREKPEVKDIEIVAIPSPYDTGLFESGVAEIVNKWEKVKGELQYGKTKYTQRILPQGVKLDLFFATKENWGLILAIRTGSAEYSHNVLAAGWIKKGYRSEDGMLMYGNKVVPVREEIELFNRIGVAYQKPQDRI
jgi:DNA polymerase/3'-5' exonuclease PolX